jgi:hypothetical protein
MIAGHKSYLPAGVELDRALSDVCDDLLTGDKDRRGRAILRYSPDSKLRSRLEVRRLELQAALTPALPADLARTLTEMMVGFSSARVNEVDAEIVVAQYVSVLGDLPLWAVQMACRRFARGKVTRAECPDWKPAYAPSTAQLYRLAEASAVKYWDEEQRIFAVINGVPAHRPSHEERKRVAREFEQLQQELRPNNVAAQITAAEARLKQPIPIAIAVTDAFKQAMRERDELEQWCSGQCGTGNERR